MSHEPHNDAALLKNTIPEFLDEASSLIIQLEKYSADDLSHLMKVSKKLAVLNYDRLSNWDKNHNVQNSIHAALSFVGEAYRGLDARSLNVDALQYSQKTLRILSGLYGVLKPLDIIQAYRLEMGTGIKFNGQKSLCEFWKEKITRSLHKAVKQSPGDKILINLASKEYSSAINFGTLNCKVVNVSFYEEKNGTPRMVTVYAKKARGLFARFIIVNKIQNADDLKAFESEGYYFDSRSSSELDLVFKR